MSLPADVTETLNQLLLGLMSQENSLRHEAEKHLEAEWRSNRVNVLLVYLAQTCVTAPDANLSTFAAVLFRRIAIRTPKELAKMTDRTIGVIDNGSKEQIRSFLLQGFSAEHPPHVRRKIADAISEMAKEDALPRGTWGALLPALFSAASNVSADYRELAFRVFAASPEILEERYLNEMLTVLSNGFGDANDDVRIAAFDAYVAFFRELPKAIWQTLTPLLPSVLNALPRFLEQGQDEALANVLQALIELVELAPKMFKEMFPTIIEFCATVAKDSQRDGSARMAALELLTTFSEVSPTMCKQTASYTSNMVLITILMLTEVLMDDDEAREWLGSENTEDYEDEVEYDAARQALDRVSLRLGGKALAAPLFQYVPAMLQLSNWREVFAALMAISSAAEGCVDVLITEIPKLLDLVLPLLTHPHPRVQYACCNALGQMLTDFADVIQNTAGERILPGLISKLTEASAPRVQAHAAAALVNFSEAALKETLEPYLDSLLNNLLGLLQQLKRYVQEQVLTTIAIIADAAEQKFIKYHDTLLPLLIDFLKTEMGPEYRTLKAKCIECATLIALAVGRDNFAPYSAALIASFGQLQESVLQDDDPVKLYLEQGWGRVCRVIGLDFVPFLPAVLPPLLQAAKAAQDISLLEEDEAEEYGNDDEWDVINLGGKLIAVHTASLDDKVLAMDLIRVYATQLKGDFFPWVKECVQDIALPALDFYLHDGVRALAALTLAALMRATVAATSSTSAETLAVWLQICHKLADALTAEPVHELLVAYYTSLVECVSALGPNTVSLEQLTLIAKALETNLDEIYERIKKRDTNDDEYTEDIDDNADEYTDEELLDEINKVVLAVFGNAQGAFLEAFQSHLLPTAYSFMKDDNPSVRLCGLCAICDVLDHCGKAFAQTTYLSFIVSECLTAPQANIRQAAAYAVGVAAQKCGPEYAEICVGSLPTLFEIATFPDARAEENVCATEVCVLGIAKICRQYGSSLPNLDKMLRQWVLLLPVTQDEEAAAFAYDFLSDLVLSLHPAVLEQSPKAVEAVLQALSSNALKDPVAEKSIAAARNLLTSMAQDDARAILLAYPDKAVIGRWFT